MPLETAPFVTDLVASNPANSDNVQQGADHLRLIKAALLASFPTITAPITATPAQINGWEARTVELEARNPVGAPHLWLLETPPPGWLLLRGQEVLRTSYPALFALWGTTFGGGNGTTTFNLPDFSLRFIQGAAGGDAVGATGGTKTPAVSVAAAGAHSHSALSAGAHTHTVDGAGQHSHGGSTGGHAITWGQMPSHNHGVSDPGHGHNIGPATAFLSTVGFAGNVGWGGGSANIPYSNAWVDGATTGISIQNAGGNEAHAHSIFGDGWHAHTAQSSGAHTHTIDSQGAHTHAATIADGRPPYLNVNFIVRAA